MSGRIDVDDPRVAAERACVLGDAVAVAVNVDHTKLSILTATPFGTTLRRWSGQPPAAIAEIIKDTLAAQRRSFVFVTDADGHPDDGVFDSFAGRKADLPVSFDADGRPRASWWSIAPFHNKPFQPGDELEPVVVHGASGCSIVYFHQDGRAAGTHISTTRIFDHFEMELIRSSRAIIRTVSSGRGHNDAGTPIDTQVLGLDLPYDFALAFSEGILPLRPAAQIKEAAYA